MNKKPKDNKLNIIDLVVIKLTSIYVKIGVLRKEKHVKSILLICWVLAFSFNSLADPIVIAHRGASGYLPEHTLAAATLAHAQGADYIEQDLVLTKDLVPVVLHDIHIDTVTNVAHIYPNRMRKDGRFYAFDFTLAELKTLTVNERKNLNGKAVYPNRYQGNADFKIATFEEQIELINQLNRQFNKQVGFYPEIKAPAWHKAQGADISKVVLNTLRKYQLDHAKAAIFLQCFDFDELKRIRQELGAKVKLIQLIGENSWQESPTDYQYLKSKQGLKEIAEIAQGIGPWIPQLIDKKGNTTPFALLAKQSSLMIHPYTYRRDDLPFSLNKQALLDLLFKQIAVDGLFSDFPDDTLNYLTN